MIVAIIPAKKGSKRLKNKNLRIILKKPLLYWTAIYTSKSKIIKNTYVSSESKTVLSYAKKIGLKIIHRPKNLCGETPIIDVYKHAYSKLKKKFNIKAVVGLQPDHPDRNLNIDKVINKFLSKKIDFLYSIDQKRKKNGAHYILSKKILDGKNIKKKTFVIDNCTNIHFKNDLIKAEKNLKKNEKKN